MRVTFWGVRGTFPSAGAAFARYGGDTMCIEVECGDARLILDAGSGMRALGAKLNAQAGPIHAHVILSHLHLDHIMGLAHFAPLWREDARIGLYAAEECLTPNEDAVFSVLRPPLFPLEVGELPASIGLQSFPLGGTFMPAAGVLVRSAPVSHPGACSATIIEFGGLKLGYITDHEPGDAEVDARLAEVVEGAALLIHDATFTGAEAPSHRGWGHSSWEAALRFKQRAGVKLLALAHHSPDRTDDELDVLGEAAAASPNVFFARQGLSLCL
jgi:phosphoribosyl 1,2-cyclic phosphodiesterase